MNVLKLALNIIRFHLEFLLTEFCIFYLLFVVISPILNDSPFGNRHDRFGMVLPIGFFMGIIQLSVRTVLGNYIAYYFLWRMKLGDLPTYLLSLVIVPIFWIISTMLGEEIGGLALKLLEVPSWFISVFGGIAITNYVMVKNRNVIDF